MTQGLIIVGDVLDGLARLDDNSVDAVVTDPPYDLLQASRKGSGRSNNPDSPAGRHGTKAGGFMGMAWDATGVAFRPETWEACLRVLKPGGHLIAFGGGRTHHRMWCAIEDAGFEVRELICYLFGTGFPKSLDVSKAIDKAAGAEREVVGDNPNHRPVSGVEYEGIYAGGNTGAKDVTAPATDAAKQWEGYGTALKPAVEPILLARKPLSEPTVAANVLKWGTGALAIDATRIGTTKDVPASRSKNKGTRTQGVYGADPEGSSGFDPNVGRWPSNVIFECTCDDSQPLPDKRKRKDEPTQSTLLGDTEPTPAKPETPQGTVHQPDCPAGMLDAQSGERPSAGRVNRKTKTGYGFGDDGYGEGGVVTPQYYDTGGVSRFFYCAKASRAERERGLEDFEPVTGAEAVNRKPDTAGLKSPRAGAGRSAKQVKCDHPTVKPIALMRWLVRLVTPPGGLVLDPFCGSGSTLIAAREEGHDFVGVDLSPEYCRIAEARVGGAQVVAAETLEDTDPEWEE